MYIYYRFFLKKGLYYYCALFFEVIAEVTYMKIKEVMRALSLLTQVGIAMFVPIFLCVLLGSFIDEKLGTGVVFLIIFIIIGVISSFRSLYVLTSKFFK